MQGAVSALSCFAKLHLRFRLTDVFFFFFCFFFENDYRFPSVGATLILKNDVSELKLRIDLQNQCANFEQIITDLKRQSAQAE